MASSQLTNSPKQNKSVIRLSLLYNKIADAIVTIQNNENVYLIRYEDLTTDTESILRQTCEFLNIAFDSSLVDNVAAPPGIVSEHEFWKDRNVKVAAIQKSNPDKWKDALDNKQENLVNFITKSHAAKFGYVLTYNRIAMYKGFSYDIKRLLLPKELKKVFFDTHG